MVENIVERAIVPHNPAQARVIEKEKYDLFAPIAKNGQAGMAKFDKGAFFIKDGEVYLHKDAIIELVGDAFARSLGCNWSSDVVNALDLHLKSSTGDTLSKVNIKLEAYLGISEPNAGSRDWLTIKLTATDDRGIKYTAYQNVLLPITQIRDLRFVQQNETDKYKLVLEYFDAVNQAIKTVEVDVPEYPIATSTKAGVVKVSQGSSTNIGITDGLIKVLKATEEHIAARGANDTDYVLTASKTNAIVKAALTDGNKMVLADDEKAKARGTIGAASTEDVNGMSVAFTMGEGFNLTVSLLNAKNEVISTGNVDLPLEEMIVGGKVSDDGKNIILTLKNGQTIEFSVATLVNGLVKQEDFDKLKAKVELAPTLAGNEPDKAPSVQAVNEGLDKKLDKIETADTYMRAYVVGKDGTQKTVSVTDAVVGEVVVQRKVGGQVWVPEDPNYKNSATSKKYVDDTAAAIRAELGKQVFTVSQGSYSHLGWYVPNGALPNFYLETTLFEYSYEVDGVYGENFAKANFTQLTFLGENNNVLGTEDATPQTFYKMPSGTVKIRSNAIELASEASRNPPWDNTGLIHPDLKFQVKVGT